MVEETDSGSTKTSAARRSFARDARTARPTTDTQAIASKTADDAGSLAATPAATKSAATKSATTKSATTKSAGAVVPAARKRPTELKERVVLRPEAGGDVQLGFLSDFVGFHLRLAQDASYRTFAKHRDKDLIKPGRYPAMAIIHLNPGISQSALGRAIARDKSTVSPLIKDLQKNGFINRKASVHDRRSVTLSLTKKGERILDRLHVRAQEHESELDRLVGASKGRLMVLLGKIISGMAV